MSSVLVVDDEKKLGRLVGEALELDGHTVEVVTDGRAALASLSRVSPDVVVTDLKMSGVDGLELLRAARALPAPPEVVLMTAYGSAESAVAAMKAGAADYVVKPFAIDEMRLRVRRLVGQRATERRNARLADQLSPQLIAESPRMREAVAAARQVAATDATVLLLGESGTGKSELARFIHFHSRRVGGPLAELHCAALPEALLESELFGHEKGAFTGASTAREGHLQAADGGTLFLDEIGEVTPATQVKLLRFLQDRTYVPVGATAARRVDVRVVAATNRNLAEAVKAGHFREDFFYRLNVFAIELAPLRDRLDDVLPLAERYLSARGVPPARLSPSARSALAQRTWPGNVRELHNALERALILSGGEELSASHVTALQLEGQKVSRAPEALLSEGFNLDAFERQLLEAAIVRAGGNKSAAARMLGITRRRLYSRLESLDARIHGDDE